MSSNWLFKSLVVTSSAVFCLAAQAQNLHIYNWSDYIADDTISRFEKETGIKVSYDVYDSNEVLEAKLLAGRSGYDLVFPTAHPFADRLIKAKLYQPLDKSKLSNYGNLDSTINGSLTDIDPGNAYVVPYMWGTTGIAYNKEKVEKILGAEMPKDTWRLIFDPEIVSKLASCGVALQDDVLEVFTAAWIYKGLTTQDYSKESVQKATDVITAVRPHIRYFHNSQTINDLANGDICVAHGYSGDMLQARDRAEEANNGVQIEYVIPQEGAVVWTDVMAIPADAPNVESAHKFINFILQPENIAPISNYVSYANANAKATALVDPEVRNNPGIYPAESMMEKLVTMKTPSDRQAREMTRAWTRVKTGR